MQIYTHDYTLPSQAEMLLAEALVKIRWDNYWDAKLRIEEARSKLEKYLAQDNMVEDNDAEGWVRLSDIVVGEGDNCKLILVSKDGRGIDL